MEHLALLDWDFASQSTRAHYPHNLCWYPSRFLPHIPAQLIEALSLPGQTIFDPFCGSGTTLVEALKLGRNAVGTDISPVGILLSKAKAALVLREISSVSELMTLHGLCTKANRSLFRGSAATERPEFHAHTWIDELSQWYHPETLQEMLSIYSLIQSIKCGLIREVAKAAFIAVTMPASGLGNARPYTYYADNVKPKMPEYKSAFGLFQLRLERVLTGHPLLGDVPPNVFAKINQADARHLSALEIPSIDLIVTSPPYFGVTDYITGFRLAHYWFDFGQAISTIKNNEIGARWTRRRSGSSECYRAAISAAFTSACAFLSDNGKVAAVVGQAKNRNNQIVELLSETLSTKSDLRLTARNSRNISKNYFLHPDGGVESEQILIFEKR